MAKLLITGGAGFIGIHTCLTLIESGHNIIILDSLLNSSPNSIKKLIEISDLNEDQAKEKIEVVIGDIRNKELISSLFLDSINNSEPIDAVIHLAGLKAVNESIQDPFNYWDVNVNGAISLLSAMDKHNCKTLIFSSSATVYGVPNSIPISEDAELRPINPYGNTKLSVEKFLKDIYDSDNEWKIISLRYFNPVGAHISGLIGEDPLGKPNNLFPIISQVAIGRREKLQVYGDNWPTEDGTCIRDYIHTMDLAEGHLAAFNYLQKSQGQCIYLNLGIGNGISVLEVLKEYEKASSRKINFEITQRRPGDVPVTIADPSSAKKLLNWNPSRSLKEMCRDSWSWQSKNPNGY